MVGGIYLEVYLRVWGLTARAHKADLLDFIFVENYAVFSIRRVHLGFSSVALASDCSL